jgi:two-component system NtrC family sensor kinase
MDTIPDIGAAAADEYQLIVQTSARLIGSDPDKVMQVYLRGCRDLFGADAACAAVLERGRDEPRQLLSIPRDAEWDPSLIHALTHGTATEIPPGTLGVRVERRGRPWGALVLRRESDTFTTAQRRALARVASEIETVVRRQDDATLADVRAKIDMKILRDLAPKDLYYQILDGLHRLTRYDHSGSLYLYDDASGRLELVAEQVAWRKMKSERIGETYLLPERLRTLVREDVAFGFDRSGNGWSEWTRLGAAALAPVLDPPRSASPENGEPALGSMLCAAVGSSKDGLGLLRIGALRPGAFGEYELDIVQRFVPSVSVALQRAQAAEHVRRKVLDVERRAALAHLARGVAHDVNNALGAVLPLVQQMRAELEEGRLDPTRLREDLEQIERSVDTGRRIFSGMLRWAKGSTSPAASSDAGRAISNACGVLGSAMTHAGVTLDLEIPADLPPVDGRLSEMEQLFLNLATNAIEAMPRGGRLKIAARAEGDHVWVEVTDTGHGIPPDLLPQVDKPFVTTKEGGTGLGLPTCRSILVGVGGDLAISSDIDVGTRVTLRLRAVTDGEG